MTRNRKIATAALAAMAIAGALAAAPAHARGGDVQWSVTVGSPGVVQVGPIGLPLPPVPIVTREVVRPAPIYYPAPAPRSYGYYGGRGYGDRDRDGIPNRYDRVYNPRWDRDGDRIPDRYERREWRDHHDRHDDRRDGRRY